MKAIGLYDDNYNNCNWNSGLTPLMKITSDRNDFLNSFCKSLMENNNQSISIVGDLTIKLTELADNIFFHSGDRDNDGEGYAVGMIKDGVLTFSFVDLGCGFRGSYKRHGLINDRTDKSLLRDSFNELETCLKNVDKKRGIGLYEVAEYLKLASGEIIISSGNALLVYNGIEFQVFENEYFQGTASTLKVNL